MQALGPLKVKGQSEPPLRFEKVNTKDRLAFFQQLVRISTVILETQVQHLRHHHSGLVFGQICPHR